MPIEVDGSERRYLRRRRPVRIFLPQPLPNPLNPRTAGYISPMATVSPNKKHKPSRYAGSGWHRLERRFGTTPGRKQSSESDEVPSSRELSMKW